MCESPCAFDYASVTFNEADESVLVLTGRGPWCECRAVPRKSLRLKELETLLAVMRARCPSLGDIGQ